MWDNVRQTNLQKSKEATGNLAQLLVEWLTSPFSVLFQELWAHKDKVGLPADGLIVAGTDPRAGIFATKDLNMVAMDQFIMDNLAVCRWSMGDEENHVVIVILYYANIMLKPVSKELDKVLVYCRSNSLPVLIGADTNVHSSLWGCQYNNRREDMFEETACQYSLTICNVGATPTFATTRASSIIDVTMIHSTICDQIKEWTVLKETFHFDHCCIQFIGHHFR
jgi:hypothetical protein